MVPRYWLILDKATMYFEHENPAEYWEFWLNFMLNESSAKSSLVWVLQSEMLSDSKVFIAASTFDKPAWCGLNI